MPRPLACWLALLAAALPAAAEGPRKEPAYPAPPAYLRLIVGPAPAETVWLAVSGDTLHVDRNGDGDLTGPGEAVAAVPRAAGVPDDGTREFEVGELTVAGRTHKGLTVRLIPLAAYDGSPVGARADVRKVLAADPKARAARVTLDADRPEFRGGGIGGRCTLDAGPADLAGVLQFAPTPGAAPAVNAGGPLAVTFADALPVLKTGRPREFTLAVGAPGTGPGTFASLAYDDTIPKAAHPVAEVTYPPAAPGAAPVTERYELKRRC